MAGVRKFLEYMNKLHTAGSKTADVHIDLVPLDYSIIKWVQLASHKINSVNNVTSVAENKKEEIDKLACEKDCFDIETSVVKHENDEIDKLAFKEDCFDIKNSVVKKENEEIDKLLSKEDSSNVENSLVENENKEIDRLAYEEDCSDIKNSSITHIDIKIEPDDVKMEYCSDDYTNCYLPYAEQATKGRFLEFQIFPLVPFVVFFKFGNILHEM